MKTTDEKLKIIEDNTFDMGNQAFNAYKVTQHLDALRGSVIAYRTSMQSIRYQLLFSSSIKEKK
jgi:hypothetical protein